MNLQNEHTGIKHCLIFLAMQATFVHNPLIWNRFFRVEKYGKYEKYA